MRFKMKMIQNYAQQMMKLEHERNTEETVRLPQIVYTNASTWAPVQISRIKGKISWKKMVFFCRDIADIAVNVVVVAAVV